MEESVVPAKLTSLGFGPVANNVVQNGWEYITKLSHTYVHIIYINTYMHKHIHTYIHTNV